MSASKLCPQCGAEYPANARFCEADGTALRSAMPGVDLVGSIVADRYHVMRKLGEGGMGQVYLAEHVKMGRKSALKVMRASMKADIDAVSRFNREAANASRIAHANVASVYDFGETPEGIIYLAMEYVDGPSLTKIIERQGALPPKRAAEIVRQTAEALAAAHDLGIVHRDLKPDNIMVATNRDGSDCVKVVDFGIAKAAGNAAQNVTKAGLIVGTPAYMSPEQLAGDKVDGRSDIYSLGLVAYHVLTGQVPFPSESAQESMIMRLTERPQPLAVMKPETTWSSDVQAVIDRALERDANARYQNAIEFGMALSGAIDRMPGESAVPPTRIAVTSEKSNRVPAMVAAAAVIVALIIGATKYGRGEKPVVPPAGSVAYTDAPSGTAPIADSSMRAAQQAAAPQSKGRDSSEKPMATPAPDVDKQLAALLNDAQARVTADAALRKVGTLGLRTEDQKAEAAYVRYMAFLTKDEKDSACAEVRDIVTVFSSSKRAHDAQKIIEAGC